MDIFIINGKTKADINNILNNLGHAYISDDFCYFLEENSGLISQNARLIIDRDCYDVTFLECEKLPCLITACEELLANKLASEFDKKFKRDMVGEINKLKTLCKLAIEKSFNLVFMGD